jgi:hypothetical protein
MPLYVCRNHADTIFGHPFEAEKPVCPKCGMDRDADPTHAQYITERVVIHLEPPHAVKFDRGAGHAACNPDLKVGRVVKGVRVVTTGEPLAVTCEACKQTEAFANGHPVPGGMLNAR